MRINLQPAYILHSRPYRDSSLLLEVLTAEHGRISLVGRGARRRSRGGSNSALLQPFRPLLLSFGGRGELRNLQGLEAAAAPLILRGERLYSGLYLNELLVRLLHRHDPHPPLFAAYSVTLQELVSGPCAEAALRRFELQLLNELGYGFELAVDGISGEPIAAQHWYFYDSQHGMVPGAAGNDPARPAFLGADLLRMADGELDGDLRLAARRLLRLVLASHLGDTPLKSRDLFRQHRAMIAPRSGRQA